MQLFVQFSVGILKLGVLDMKVKVRWLMWASGVYEGFLEGSSKTGNRSDEVSLFKIRSKPDPVNRGKHSWHIFAVKNGIDIPGPNFPKLSLAKLYCERNVRALHGL